MIESVSGIGSASVSAGVRSPMAAAAPTQGPSFDQALSQVIGSAVDIQPFSAVLDSSPIELATTNPAHLSLPQSETSALGEVEVYPTEQTLSGNTVNLEQQMINIGDVNRDYTMNSNIRRAFHQLLLSALK